MFCCISPSFQSQNYAILCMILMQNAICNSYITGEIYRVMNLITQKGLVIDKLPPANVMRPVLYTYVGLPCMHEWVCMCMHVV